VVEGALDGGLGDGLAVVVEATATVEHQSALDAGVLALHARRIVHRKASAPQTSTTTPMSPAVQKAGPSRRRPAASRTKTSGSASRLKRQPNWANPVFT